MYSVWCSSIIRNSNSSRLLFPSSCYCKTGSVVIIIIIIIIGFDCEIPQSKMIRTLAVIRNSVRFLVSLTLAMSMMNMTGHHSDIWAHTKEEHSTYSALYDPVHLLSPRQQQKQQQQQQQIPKLLVPDIEIANVR